jgi:sigma-E factor negative regulatory protein RseA
MVNRMADKEKISALMDGESVDKALIQELEQDQLSQMSWRNYHAIGDIVRGENVEPSWNIASRVALALEDEPAHYAHQTPVNRVQLTSVDIPSLDDQPTPKVSRKQLPAWLAQFGQIAIAACVTFVVILGVQQYSGDTPSSVVDQMPVLQTIPLAGTAEPVSLTRESVEKSTNTSVVQDQRKRVNAMLQDYELQLRLNSESAVTQEDQTQSVVE